MKILESKDIISDIDLRTKKMAAEMVDNGVNFHLALVIVGDDLESLKYVHLKSKKGKELGLMVSVYHLEEKSSFEEVKETLQFLGKDEDTTGIVLQLPLPKKFSNKQTQELLAEIPAEKDVDVLGRDWENYSIQDIENSLECKECGVNCLIPPIFLAVYSLLKHYAVELKDQKIVMIGNGPLVGVPVNGLFNKLGLNCEVVDKETNDIFKITKGADIVITGTGQKDLVTYQWISEGATVINCSGDVHFDSVSQVAEAISPTIGGIGPLTVSWLLNNVVRLAYQNWKCGVTNK